LHFTDHHLLPGRLPQTLKKASLKTYSNKLFWAFLTTVAALAIAIVLIYHHVQSYGSTIYETLDAVPFRPAAIVFGAGISSQEMHDRVETAATLYKNHKVKKLLMTGDNGQLSYNEPEAMRRLAIKLGVPGQDITCDYAGFRTYDSLYRARDIFLVKNATLVTQAYHLPRAMYIAKKLGLDVIGVNAQVKSYGSRQTWYDLREIGAAAAAWLDLKLGRKPKYLGKQEPLFGGVSNAKTPASSL
jgi:SanA protein